MPSRASSPLKTKYKYWQNKLFLYYKRLKCRCCRCHRHCRCVSTVNSTYVAISAILLFCHSFRRTAIPTIPPFRHSAIPPFHHFRHSITIPAIPPFCHSAIPPFRHSAIPPLRHSTTIPPFRHSAIPPFYHSAILLPFRHSAIVVVGVVVVVVGVCLP